MKVICDLTTEILTIVDGPTLTIPIRNTVRNLTNGYRKRNELVYATTGHERDRNTYPINPDKFPKGDWLITEVFDIDRNNYRTLLQYEEALRLFGPVVIVTDAFRMTPVWDVKDGFYIKPTRTEIRDTQFWIHGSDYKTSWGCILNPSTVLQCNLAEFCREELLYHGEIPIEVL